MDQGVSAGRRLRQTRVIWAVALAIVVLAALLGGAGRWRAWHEVDRDARQKLATQVRQIDDRVGGLVRGINLALGQILETAARDGRCDQRQLDQLGRLYPESRTFAVFDARGVIRCASRAELVGRTSPLAETVKARPQDNVLVVHPPFVGLTGLPVLVFSQAKTNPQGRLETAAVGAIDLRYFDELLASMRGENQGIYLAHQDGLVLSRLPDPEQYRLKDISRAPNGFAAHRDGGQRVSVARTVSALDGIERYVACSDVAPANVMPPPAGHLVACVSEKVEDVYADWRRNNHYLFLGWLAVSLAILGFASLVARRQEQIESEVDKRRKTAESLAATAGELIQQQDALDEHAIVSVTDIAGTIISANDKFCAISGYAREELIGKNHRILNSGTHPPEFFREMWQTIADGRPWHGLICNRARDGHFYWVNSSIVPMFDGAGRIERYVGIRTDVTPLVRAQTEIRKSEINFHSIFDNLQDVFYRTDLDGHLTLVSPSVEAMLGYAPRELIGRKLVDFWVEPELRAAFLQRIEADGGRTENYLTALRRKDGETIWASTNAHYYRDADGNVAGIEGLTRDVTQRMRDEETLRQAKEEAEAANQAKSVFLSSMSHELRTPLNAILGFSELLEYEELAVDARESVGHIHNAGRHLLRLINDILDLARIEAGKMEVVAESVDVGALIAEGLELMRPLAARRGVEVAWQRPAAALEVCADPGRLKQVLLNLVSNAVKYNREGGRVTLGVDRRSGGRVRISVADTGSGLSPEQLAGVFTPFSRFAPTTVEGTGIGLTITRRLVELMGGAIGVDSTPDVGSTFWIEMDEAPVDATRGEPQAAAASADATAAAPAGAGAAPRGRVLYIEDNPGNMRLMQSVLQRFPEVTLLMATEPTRGLELARSGRPDLILLDITLPEMDGFEVLRRLRADATTRDIAVVAVSANAMPDDIEAGRAAGFDDYLTKPLNIDVLLKVVEGRLTGRPTP